MTTPFSEANAKFTAAAHSAAESIIYPQVFGVPQARMKFIDVTNTGWDLHHGVDWIVQVPCGRKCPLEFSVQERFRETQFASFGDLTITEWNNASNERSELYKIKAMLFVYGYYDPTTNTFADAICVNVPDLLRGILSGAVASSSDGFNARSKQQFFSAPFSSIESAGAVRWRLKPSGTYAPRAQTAA